MTDKQMIIDKVNVKECKYYCHGNCVRYEDFVEADYANDYSVKCICEEENILGTYDICDYQQLKSKEQELEELQETIDDFITDNNSLYSDDGKQPSNLDELQECMQSSMNEFVKYKQILSEIKEIAEIEIECKTYEIENDCFNETRCKALNEHIDFIKQILQKISECEVKNE